MGKGRGMQRTVLSVLSKSRSDVTFAPCHTCHMPRSRCRLSQCCSTLFDSHPFVSESNSIDPLTLIGQTYHMGSRVPREASNGRAVVAVHLHRGSGKQSESDSEVWLCSPMSFPRLLITSTFSLLHSSVNSCRWTVV